MPVREKPKDQPGFDYGTTKTDGQHENYPVLPQADRDAGFVRPVRRAYKHLTCGAVTTMSQAIAETYARDPSYYGATFCGACGGHFPVGENGEFIWADAPNEKVGT